jgi:hypothetical protein
MPRTSARHLLDFRAGLSFNCYEIDLASSEMLSTTSLRCANVRARRRGPRSHGNEECFGSTSVRPEFAKMKKHGVAAHSRFAGQEL